MAKEFTKILESPKAEVALFSTFDFDPLFFENRILKKKAIIEAKRILIFMDYRCYQKLSSSDVVPKFLNQRYLLVPVQNTKGVFHPKLHLLIGRSGAKVICGSNNLTQPGSIHNLELFNVFNCDFADTVSNNKIAQDAYNFFENCIPLCEGVSGKIAKRWLTDLAIDYTWFDTENSEQTTGEAELIQTFASTPWDWLVSITNGKAPECIYIISPFFDKDLRLLKKIKKKWQDVPVSIYAQQQSSNLPGSVLDKINNIKLYHLDIPNSRRLHAKLIALDFGSEVAVLSGSCNFTSAAFDGLNIEAAISIKKPKGFIDSLFPDDVSLELIRPSEFISNERDDSGSLDSDESPLILWGAQLNKSGLLSFHFKNQLYGDICDLNVILKSPSEKEPRRIVRMPDTKSGNFEVQLSEGENAELPSTSLFCQLDGTLNGSQIKSSVSWVIHEHRLTHEHSGSTKTGDRERIIRDTGHGLTAYLDALIDREGNEAAIEFLNHMNIRFQDGPRSGGGIRLRPPSPHDPTISQSPPLWSNDMPDAFGDAVFDFVKRHYRNVLRKHARSGNINGLENYLDVFSATNKLMFINCERGLINPQKVMSWFLVGLYSISMGGKTVAHPDKIEGFMSNVMKAQSGNLSRLNRLVEDYGVVEHTAFALVSAQRINMIHVRGSDDLPSCLPKYAKYTKLFFNTLKIRPNQDRYESILKSYGIDDNKELLLWWDYIITQNLF